MEWIQNVLEIHPIFKCNETYWTKSVNEILVEETESDKFNLSYLILDSLERHFSGDWGEADIATKEANNNSLQQYFQNNKTGSLLSIFSNDTYTLIILTSCEYSETIIMFSFEYDQICKM